MSGRAITAIIVSRGLDAMLGVCLTHLRTALADYGQGDHRIVVVDNASPHPYDSASLGQGVEVLRCDCPRSFSFANNIAAHRYPNPLYLLLNNDVLLHECAVTAMADVLRREPNAGICGTRMVFADGTIQHDGVVFGAGDTGPYHRARGEVSALVSRETREWQAVTGACMLIRHDLWSCVRGLCEDYPFGLEDIDLCLRARQAGWRTLCSSGTDSLHFESMTPGRTQLDIPSRSLFMKRWKGRYGIDG